MTTGRINQVCTLPPTPPHTQRLSMRRRRQQYRNIPEGEKQAQGKLQCGESSHVNAWQERSQQQCCFHLDTKQLQCNQKMHKLALIDNCTQVLLPTQAWSLASAAAAAAAILIPASPNQNPSAPCAEWTKAEPTLTVNNLEGRNAAPLCCGGGGGGGAGVRWRRDFFQKCAERPRPSSRRSRDSILQRISEMR